MNETKLGNFEAVALVLAIIINHVILILPKVIIANTKSAALINVIYISIIAFIFALLIYKLLSKFPGYDILDISKFLGGTVFKNVIGILFFSYYIFSCAVLLRNFCNFLEIAYYPLTDIVFLILLFLIAAAISCKLKYNAIFKTNLIIIPVVLISILFLFVGNFKNFSVTNIFPILGDGIGATFFSGTSNLFAFSGLSLLYFLPPNLKQPENFKKITIWCVVLSFLYLMLSTSTILLIFPPDVATSELVPLYSAVRYIEFGTFFQRLDAVFLLIWIISFACYLSIVIKFAAYIFKSLSNIKTSRPLIYPFALLILAISLLAKNDAVSTFFENTVYKYAFFIIVVFIGLGILLLANLKQKAKLEEVNFEK